MARGVGVGVVMVERGGGSLEGCRYEEECQAMPQALIPASEHIAGIAYLFHRVKGGRGLSVVVRGNVGR
jgi:hypothetical protein